jgi:tetratricopeptide (TPR) repeat protein
MDPALVATIAADRRPVDALRERIEVLAMAGRDAEAALLFETFFYRLQPYADARLPHLAASVYRRLGRPDPAFLLEGLAAQLQPPQAVEGIDEEAARILAGPAPDALLLGALERLAGEKDWLGSARLFESVWPHARPVAEYWVYFRMSAVYEALERRDAAALLAALAVQIEPDTPVAHEPYLRLFNYFRTGGRLRDAAELVLRQRALCPDHPLLPDHDTAELLRQAGPLAAPPAPPSRRSRVIIAAETRAPRIWRLYGGALPKGLVELQEPMQRPAVTVTEIRHAEVLTADNHVAVFGADGAPHLDLSVGLFPALLRRRIAALRAGGESVAQREIDIAVLNIDQFPLPNLCHFLLDHATRLLLYRRAGIDLSAVTVIGPSLRAEYQHLTAARIGLGGWQATDAPARLFVRRLFVSSNCRHLRHPAHWAARWAIEDIRGLFDVMPRARTRRLLVSRADAEYRRLVNEDEIAALLTPFGFEVIVPGRLPFAEQIAAFRDATHVVAPHGAGLTNILFCAPGTHVLEAFHPHYGSWAYAMLADALDLDYAPLLGRDGLSDAAALNDPAAPLPHRNACIDRYIRIDPAEVRRWLDDTGAA